MVSKLWYGFWKKSLDILHIKSIYTAQCVYIAKFSYLEFLCRLGWLCNTFGGTPIGPWLTVIDITIVKTNYCRLTSTKACVVGLMCNTGPYIKFHFLCVFYDFFCVVCLFVCFFFFAYTWCLVFFSKGQLLHGVFIFMINISTMILSP